MTCAHSIRAGSADARSGLYSHLKPRRSSPPSSRCQPAPGHPERQQERDPGPNPAGLLPQPRGHSLRDQGRLLKAKKKKKVRLAHSPAENTISRIFFSPSEHRRWEERRLQGATAGASGHFPDRSGSAPPSAPPPGRGSQRKVTRRTDAACESASPGSLPSPLVQVVRRGTEGASKFPGAPPGRRLARSKVPWWRSLETRQGEKLAVSISSGSSPREEKKTQKTGGRPNPAAPPSPRQHLLVLARPGRGPARSWSRAPRTYLGQCPGRGALRVLRAPGGRFWPRQRPRWLHRRRRLRAAPGGAPSHGGARRAGAPIARVQPRAGGARLDGVPGRGAHALLGAAGVRPSVRL